MTPSRSAAPLLVSLWLSLPLGACGGTITGASADAVATGTELPDLSAVPPVDLPIGGDLASTASDDLAIGSDLATSSDLASAPDLALPVDAAVDPTPDLARNVVDLAAPLDLATPADLAPPRDLAGPPPDLILPVLPGVPGSTTKVPMPGFAMFSQYSYYWIYLPKDYDGKKRHAALLDLHGAADPASDPAGFVIRSWWTSVAEARSLIVIQPESRRRGWGIGGMPDYSGTGPDSDHAYILAALDDALRTRAIDPTRVYMQGFSSGSDYGMGLCVKEHARFRGCAHYMAGLDARGAIFGRDTYKLGISLNSLPPVAQTGIRVFHVTGELDVRKPTVEAAHMLYVENMFTTRLHVAPGVGHDVPSVADRLMIYDWLAAR